MQKLLIKQGQGFKSTVYICTAGYQTIGYGHKLLPHQKGKLNYVTENQAEAILDKDIQKAKIDAQFWFGKQCLDQIGSIRKAVLVDMSFNMGCLYKWPKLKQAVQNYDFKEASDQIIKSKYANQVGDRAKRNQIIMKTGKLFTKQSAKKYELQEYQKMQNKWQQQSRIKYTSQYPSGMTRRDINSSVNPSKDPLSFGNSWNKSSGSLQQQKESKHNCSAWMKNGKCGMCNWSGWNGIM